VSLLPPDTPLPECGWIPPARIQALGRIGLQTLADLVQHFPRRHEDRIRFDRFPEGDSPAPVCLYGEVVKTEAKRYGGWRRGFEAVIESSGGALSQRLTCRWFNAYYVQKMLATGMRIVIFGKTKAKGRKIVMDHPEFELVDDTDEKSIHFNRITPVHPAGEGVTPRLLRSAIYHALERTDLSLLPSLLPRESAGDGYGESLRKLHFPSAWEELEHIRPRLVLEEFFGLQMLLVARREEKRRAAGTPKKNEGRLWQSVRSDLPFVLTSSQENVIREIQSDLESPEPMSRLLQGDVGSGKTMVALAAALQTIESGYQAAIMAPTQILAEQHYQNFQRLLHPLGLRLSLQTGSRKESSILPLFTGEGEPQLVVGTHALLYETTRFERLGLVVIDEQHKFGVLQRSRLMARGNAPDLLVMTATPIPRTLTQTLYGDMEVSILREKPALRGKIITAVRPETKLPEITRFLHTQLEEGRQIYVVYPLVEESDKLEAKAATEEFEKWSCALAPFSVGLLHGRMKPDEKERTMGGFRDGSLRVLVATTVVEVGVDVPNATVMLIENADRFGLAQIHQLRGRVGRGTHKSYCILVHKTATPEAATKLEVLEKTEDGFAIAEADLQLRGPGDLAGTAQTGLPPFRLGDLLRDAGIMNQARSLAESLLREDPELSAPGHRALKLHVDRFSRQLLATEG
jgi:ATP-dependent DNA helicase RecG